ncbi:MAG: TRAP transporter substrate-binding protein DctP [Serpentinimonas sp.]|jgi:TRAP-type C4-dicarboxylate transport system substrate-binding protein|nr:TRAP transporter substrate-binding protein DctP [Serpentinimonas sp.]
MRKTTSPLLLRATVLACAAMAMATAAQAQSTTLRLSTYVNEVDIRYQGFKKFAELVNTKTSGRVKVEVFPSSTLHGWSEGVDAMLGGVSDISWVSADKRLPCYRVTSLYPAAINLSKQIELDAAYAALIAPEAAKAGLVPLINSNYSYDQEWWFKNNNTDLAKLDGKLVRSIGPLVSMMIETWGGKPVFIAPKEVFQSAERGVVDGINMGVATYSAWKLWGVMPHMVQSNLFYGNIQYMISKRKFDSLSPADQKALQAAAAESEVWLKPQYERWVDESMADAVKQGGTVTKISAEKRKALLDSVVGKWTPEVDAGCGPELAGKVRTLFRQHSL